MTRRVYMRDVSAAGFCSKGARLWLRGRGLSVQDFIRDGMSQEELESIDDEFGNRILKRMRARAE